MKRILLRLATCFVAGLSSSISQANINGSDFQTFNPTTNGLDFVTVQSSETLQPYHINMGLFVNYAINSLTYNKTVSSNYQSGKQRADKITGMDLSIGTGLTKRWDFGINVPFLIGQSVEDNLYVDSFETGATEIKANTKYRFVGDDNGGVAGIVSFNKNLVENNPFAGNGAGLTWNFEVAADTVIKQKWAAGANFGYRKRSPGQPIPNLPFAPMEDQWIYSLAGSYLLPDVDTKLIAELNGSRAAEKIDPMTDRALNALEGLLGVKHDYSQSLAMHLGFTRRLDQALGGAEWRVYAGLNWVVGPIGKISGIESGRPSGRDLDPPDELMKLDTELLFKHDSAVIEEEHLHALDETLRPFLTSEFRTLIVEGHTDSVGPASYNQNLSERRARTIANFLIEKYKLDKKKIQSVGLGETQPIGDNGNYQGRRKNRRVELKIWRKQKLKKLTL